MRTISIHRMLTICTVIVYGLLIFVGSWTAVKDVQAQAPQTASTSDTSMLEESGGSVTGRVRRAADGVLLEDIEVCVEPNSGGIHKCATSGEDGVYLIEGLPTGNYSIGITEMGYAVAYFDEKGSPEDADRIQVLSGEILDGIDFNLNPGGSISGTVTGLEGATLEGVTVEIGTDFTTYSACTDAEGNYTISGIPYDRRGHYFVRASVKDTCPNELPAYAQEYYEEATRLRDYTVIMFSQENPSHVNIDFTLDLGGSISGTVTSFETGLPLEDIPVCVETDDGRDLCGMSGVDGNYTISPVPANAGFIVRVMADNYALEYYDNKHSTMYDPTPVSVAEGEEASGIDFALDQAGIVSGFVTDIYGTPVEDAQVWIYGFGPVYADASGFYQFTSLPLGTQFRVSSGGFGDFAPEYWEEVHILDYAGWLSSSIPYTDINFTLGPYGSISGTVTDANGAPLADIQVTAHDFRDRTSIQESAWTDLNGHYVINGLTPDNNYTVSAWVPDFGTQYYDQKPLGGEADHVSVNEGLTTTGIDFNFDQRGGTLSGTVTDEEYQPLANIRVELSNKDMVCTDENGHYSFTGLPYDIPFLIHTEDFGCGSVYVQTYLNEYWQEAESREDATPVTITMDNPDINGIDFTLTTGPVYDDTDPQIYYGYSWEACSGIGQFNDSLHITNTSGDSASFAFRGPYIYAYFFVGPAPTHLKIYIDGDLTGIIDYHGSTTMSSSGWSYILLDDTTHNFQLELDYGEVGLDAVQVKEMLGGSPGQFGKWLPVNADTDQSTRPTLQWNYSARVTSYEYCYDTTDDDTCSIWTDNGTNTSVTLSGLSEYTTYYWHVRASNIYGTTYSDDDAFWSFTTGENVESTFSDVPFDHPLFDYIEALYAAGYTSGCSTDPLMYCPDSIMNRAESAVFMLRGAFGASYTPNPTPSGILKDDWSPGYWAEKWAEAMYTEGLSAGCSANPLKYCPWIQLNRQEASVFGLRMMYGMDYVPPAAAGNVFADMTDPAFWATKWAEQAYADGLLPECGWSGDKPMFCPNDLVDRGWGAYLVVTAEGLLP